MERFKYKLTIAYDGTNYCGWQNQPNGISIQSLLEKAASTFLRSECKLIGSGRTDAGVHALGQVAHFSIEKQIDLDKLLRGINGLLPRDIRVKRAEEVELSFHACHTACGKIYRYQIHNNKVGNPFTRLYSWHVFEKLDLSLMEKAATFFLGKKDFTSFANEAHRGCASRDPVRTIKRISIDLKEHSIDLEFEGDGFLYKMVRNIVGTLVAVASRRRSIESIADIFAARDRRKADSVAPPEGLFLIEVHYPT